MDYILHVCGHIRNVADMPEHGRYICQNGGYDPEHELDGYESDTYESDGYELESPGCATVYFLCEHVVT